MFLLARISQPQLRRKYRLPCWSYWSRPLPFAWILLAAGALSSCAPVLSRQFRQLAGRPLPYEMLAAHPEQYRFRAVILGGYILDTANEPGGSWLTILQAPLDARNKPKNRDLSRGRFLVWTKKFLDPVVYSPGRRLTVGGRLTGLRQKKLDKRTYNYPVIEAVEIHLWPKQACYTPPCIPYCYDWCYYPCYRYPYLLGPCPY